MLPSDEWIVLEEVVVEALSTDRRIVDPLVTEDSCLARGVSHVRWFEAVAALKTRGLVALQTAPPSQVVLLAATNAGILRYLARTGFDMEGARARLIDAVREAQPSRPVDLVGATGERGLIIECLLDQWVERRHVVYSLAPGRRFRIHGATLEGLPPTSGGDTTEPW